MTSKHSKMNSCSLINMTLLTRKDPGLQLPSKQDFPQIIWLRESDWIPNLERGTISDEGIHIKVLIKCFVVGFRCLLGMVFNIKFTGATTGGVPLTTRSQNIADWVLLIKNSRLGIKFARKTASEWRGSDIKGCHDELMYFNAPVHKN